MALTLVEIRGSSHEWGVQSQMSGDQIEAMRADGIDVFVIENTVPGWIADCGLSHVWCFFQDVWNMRNPFKRLG